jgi:hypothetical protein
MTPGGPRTRGKARGDVHDPRLGVADRVRSIGELIDTALAMQPVEPTMTAPDRRSRFRATNGGVD